MNNIKLVAGILGFATLLAVILGTPCAMAQETKKSDTIVMPTETIRVKAPHCTVRQLDQGSGSVTKADRTLRTPTIVVGVFSRPDVT